MLSAPVSLNMLLSVNLIFLRFFFTYIKECKFDVLIFNRLYFSKKKKKKWKYYKSNMYVSIFKINLTFKFINLDKESEKYNYYLF